MQDQFLGGVVEGFYGQPWTHRQRLTLFDQMAQWGLNTYLYAPKDDLKHRAIWRELYDETELATIVEVVTACHDRGLHFIYGLSPGLDIRFADPKELDTLQARLRQMIQAGVHHFALLFDDLPGEMTGEDRNQFASIASAQASVTNAVLEWLRGLGEQLVNARLLFCPTPYCDRMVRWQLGGSEYLDTIGRDLRPDIDVLWTGPEIISEEIPVDSLRRLTDRIGREPVIWDNLHANDYDLRRLYCGPYSRSTDLRDYVRGILANPNNEFPINYIPLRTLAEYLKRDDYQPRTDFLNAASEWTKSYQTVDAQITTEDLLLLADCYYLPHADGEEAERLKNTVQTLLEQPVGNWANAYEAFREFHQRIGQIFEQLTRLRDRELFYAWSRRIWELKEELDLIRDFVDQKKQGRINDGFASETHLPATYRGGIVAGLQRQLKMCEDGKFQVP